MPCSPTPTSGGVRPVRPPGRRRRHGRLRSTVFAVEDIPGRPGRCLRVRRPLRRSADAGAVTQRGADLRYDLEISFSSRLAGWTPRSRSRDSSRASHLQRDWRLAPDQAARCRNARGAGSCDTSRGSSSSRARAASAAGRATSSRTRAPVPGTGSGSPRSEAHRESARGHRERSSAWRLTGEAKWCALGARPATSTSWCRCGTTSSSSGKRTISVCQVAGELSHARPRREIRVPTLDGDDAFRVPEGTRAGTVFRIRGKAMPSVTGGVEAISRHGAARRSEAHEEQRAATRDLARVLPLRARCRGRTDEGGERGVFDRVKDLFS